MQTTIWKVKRLLVPKTRCTNERLLDLLGAYINTTFHIEEDCKYSNWTMATYLNKFYKNTSLEPNRVMLSGGATLDIYQSVCQSRGWQHNHLYVAESAAAVPVFPKVTNIANWLDSKNAKQLWLANKGQEW